MPDYTTNLRSRIDEISPEDDDFIEELIQAARLFRPFSAAMDEFLREHGYDGRPDDADAKTAMVRAAFEKAMIPPPREIRRWFTADQPIVRETAFQICFFVRTGRDRNGRVLPAGFRAGTQL